jgi:uncharacterized FlaG/YvyC family protein
MVDLGISRTQDLQSPLPPNAPPARVASEGQDRGARTAPSRGAQRPESAARGAEARPADLDIEVRRLNDLLGKDTRIRFVINRSTNDVYVEVVDTESNRVLRTVPPSELNALAGKLTGGGLVVDKRF